MDLKQRKDLTIEWHRGVIVAALIGIVLLAAGYFAFVATFAPHASDQQMPRWTGDLSTATVSNSSVGEIFTTESTGGMNLTITGNSTMYNYVSFYGVTLPVKPPANATQLPFFTIWVKTSSVYVATTVTIQLDAGWSTTIIQKTYDTSQWRQEIILLAPFFIPPENLIVSLELGFKILKSPSPVTAPSVDFAQPSFGETVITPRGL